jgi:hypothetical protein
MPDGSALDRALIDSLLPADLPDPQHREQRYPPRTLPEGAQVTVAREANVISNSRCPA